MLDMDNKSGRRGEEGRGGEERRGEARRGSLPVTENSRLAEFSGIQGEESSQKLNLRIKSCFKYHGGKCGIYLK